MCAYKQILFEKVSIIKLLQVSNEYRKKIRLNRIVMQLVILIKLSRLINYYLI